MHSPATVKRRMRLGKLLGENNLQKKHGTQKNEAKCTQAELKKIRQLTQANKRKKCLQQSQNV